jgi:glyoxylase-like metal-dependent hydrolase (beta-lactamase superfamily II)
MALMLEENGNLSLKIFPTGDLGTNAYLIFNEQSKDCFLIDCPAPINEYRDFILKNNFNLRFIIITHGHYDHTDGLSEFLESFPVSFYIQKNDLSMLVNPLKNGSLVLGHLPVSIKQTPTFCKDDDIITFGEEKIKVIETPGHTLGSISLLLGNWLFSGDTLFYHSVGRTDLPFSSLEYLQDSIKNKLFTLDSQIRVFPGHGNPTSIGEEKENNPFIE